MTTCHQNPAPATPILLAHPPFQFSIRFRRLHELDRQLATASRDKRTGDPGSNSYEPDSAPTSPAPSLPSRSSSRAPRSERRRPFAVDCHVLLALQDLGGISRRHGRPGVDAALLHLCSTLLQHVRRSDALTRLNGGMFALVLPQTRVMDVFDVLEHLRRVVLACPLAFDGQHVRLQFWAGVTERRQHESLCESMPRACAALQSARRTGKACTHWQAPHRTHG
ncbi:diguanylate cyclase [Comamonadaceae bacterium G21597-S1]|nr:diguanylate cyclase [Comamonadaceae bacterium G21597-S1]